VTTKGRNQKRKVGGLAFVIMPFDRAFDDLHRRAIRPALEKFGFVAERYDDAPKVGTVLEEMRRSIDQARLVIAVVTGKNPHVSLNSASRWRAVSHACAHRFSRRCARLSGTVAVCRL
jgi:hypothetical protein